MSNDAQKLAEALKNTTAGVWVHADRDGPYVPTPDGPRWLGDAMTVANGRFLVEAHNRLPSVLADLERLTADLKEARRALAAEQGKPEGAPAGWKFVCDRDFDERGEWINRRRKLKVWWSPEGQRWIWGRQRGPGWFEADAKTQPKGQSARAAMLAADAAVVVAKIERLDRKQSGRTA